MQGTFDTVALGLLRQGRYSIGDDGLPALAGRGGCRCAIGLVLDMRLYDESLEACDLSDEPLRSAILPEHRHFELLSDLQDVHDGKSVRSWPQALLLVAAAHGLSGGAVSDWMDEN